MVTQYLLLCKPHTWGSEEEPDSLAWNVEHDQVIYKAQRKLQKGFAEAHLKIAPQLMLASAPKD